jgi:outer membrane murein-binding lipoprotein Lpp
MDTTEKLNSEEKETFLLVVGELAQEQVNNTKTVNDLVTAVNALTSKVDELNEKVDKPKPVIVAADTRPAQEIINKGVNDMKLIVGTKPQPVVKKFQILLFPERDAKLFYKIVFGRWFLFLVLMLLIQNLYNFSVHWSDNQKEVQREELENDLFKKAWYYRYEREGKAGKRLMDSAYVKSAQSEDK